MRNTFVDTIIDSCSERKDVFIISGDAGFGVFDDFQKSHPAQFINMGVAEQNMTSHAAGLALTDFKVFIYNIIPFVLYRNYEQVRNDICYQQLPVTLVGIGSGVTYAPGGMTHYSIEDIGIARTLPNLTVISPIDPVEARLAAEYALRSEGPVYVRLAKRGEPVMHARDTFDITVPQVIREGGHIAIVFHGTVSFDVMAAREQLLSEGIDVTLVSVPVVQPLNTEALFDILDGKKQVLCVEEHFENSGLGNIIAGHFAERRPSWSLRVMGIPYAFIHEVRTQSGMRGHYGICAEGIARAVKEL
ncbi:MAG: transketolase [Nitrospira sp.]|nr:transketolase [bacterium]MBL7048031.1 transketolase [Nitrospira sp.]